MSITTLNHTSTGEGPPLLIIHGLFGSSRNWRTLSQQFANNFSVISVDLRNHGDSPHRDEMNYQVMAQDVVNLLDQLQISQASVIGHSMGGKVAMKLSHLVPDRINQLVVADIGPVTYRHDYDDLIDAVLSLDLASLRNRKQADAALTDGIPDPRIRMFLLQNLVVAENGLQWKLNWKALKENISKIIGFDDISDWHIETPSLFIYGGQSNYLNTEVRELIPRHFAKASFGCIENAGHWLHAEQPQMFYDAVNNFLLNNE
jgi:esterase